MMTRTVPRFLYLLLSGALLTATPAGAATTTPGTATLTTTGSTGGVGADATEPPAHIDCSGQNADVHYSAGAGGAIFKTTITCTGYGATSVYVNYTGDLRFFPTADCAAKGTYNSRATANYGQWVSVGGASKVFYTPKTGNGGVGTGKWAMKSTFYFSLHGQTSTTGYSNKYVCKSVHAP